MQLRNKRGYAKLLILQLIPKYSQQFTKFKESYWTTPITSQYYYYFYYEPPTLKEGKM